MMIAEPEGSMRNDWAVYIFVFVMAAIVMARLDRLGKQLEAVCVSIRVDVARTEEEREEILSGWKQGKKEAAKDARQFWIFWGIIGAAALAWNILARHG
jgi:hypothetical protein